MNGRRALLGAQIRRLRLERKLTQVQLGEASGLGQAWISRIETGRAIPEPKTIEQLAAALKLPARLRTSLLTKATELRAELGEWPSVAQEGMRRRQERIRTIERSALQVRLFNPAIVPGLLQVPGYAGQIFAMGPDVFGAADVEGATQVRMEQQQVLFDSSKRFVFILTEQSLRWRIASPAVMVSQMDRLAAALAQTNIMLGVVPFSATVPLPPLNAFAIFDDKLVMLEALDDVLILDGESDVALYGRLFDLFGKHALWGPEIAPLLQDVKRTFT